MEQCQWSKGMGQPRLARITPACMAVLNIATLLGGQVRIIIGDYRMLPVFNNISRQAMKIAQFLRILAFFGLP